MNINLGIYCITFEFETVGDDKYHSYSAKWYSKKSSRGYRDIPEDPEKDKKKYQVEILRGGGYRTEYYTDLEPSEDASFNFIDKYLSE